jgi:hypothetical protein
MTATPASAGQSAFEQALGRYQRGEPTAEVLADFRAITQHEPRLSAGWTCLAWLELLDDQPLQALRSARFAVKLSPQDPQARINLCLAMLETNAKGVRETHRTGAAHAPDGPRTRRRTGQLDRRWPGPQTRLEGP